MKPLPALHVVTDDDVVARDGFAARAADVLAAGGQSIALHLRGPRTTGAVLYDLASELAPHAVASGGLLVINDRVDVALATSVRSVHLGVRSLRPGTARALLGDGALVGVSAHSASEAEAAWRDGADYLFAGAVFPTPSHEGQPGIGVEGLSAIAAAGGRRPIMGIGGISTERVAEVLSAGVQGVAVLRGIWSAPDPAQAVSEYISRLEHDSGNGVEA